MSADNAGCLCQLRREVYCVTFTRGVDSPDAVDIQRASDLCSLCAQEWWERSIRNLQLFSSHRKELHLQKPPWEVSLSALRHTSWMFAQNYAQYESTSSLAFMPKLRLWPICHKVGDFWSDRQWPVKLISLQSHPQDDADPAIMISGRFHKIDGDLSLDLISALIFCPQIVTMCPFELTNCYIQTVSFIW